MIKKIRKLFHMVTELGGTVYELAEDGGLLSAYHFLKLHTDGWSEALLENVKAVTEVYIHFNDSEELDRVFLYSDTMESDLDIIEAGNIQNGKFVIEYDRLKELAALGYKCLYHRSEDGHNGKAFVRYYNAFGDNRIMLPFKTWDSRAFFMGNGYNRGLFVTTRFESVFVMPDIHMVREGIRVIHAENLIRERQDATFRIERIPMEDEKVWKALEMIKKNSIGQMVTMEKRQVTESYQRLNYQIAYIMTYYPQVYELIWQNFNGIGSDGTGNDGTGNDEATKENVHQYEEDTPVTVGISLDYCSSYGVCRMPDGSIRRIPNKNCPAEMPENLKFAFEGYGTILDANISDTHHGKIAAVIENIVTSAASIYQITVDKIYVTVVETKNMDGKVLGKLLAQVKMVPEIEYVDYCTAIMNAYNKDINVKGMKVKDVVLFYDFNEIRRFLALIEKISENTFQIIHRLEESFPEDCIYEEEQEFFHMYMEWFSDFYVDEVKPDWFRIKRQLIRNNCAKIIFDNGYRFICEDYPIARLEKCFIPVLRKGDAMLTELLEKASIPIKKLSTVLLAGEDSEYPFVQEHLKQVTGKDICVVNALECVAARGAVLHKSKLESVL